jgi:DNA polymerase III subunit epsilon
LAAAVQFYLGREHAQAHSAAADVLAVADVLDAQLVRYEDLPRSIAELAAWIAPEASERATKFALREGTLVFAFGRHLGRPLDDVARDTPDYLRWLLEVDFPAEAKRIVADALERLGSGQST